VLPLLADFQASKIAGCLYDVSLMDMKNFVSCSAAQRFSPWEHSTGKERDAETGLDYFGARYYFGTQGRFLTTDPIILTSKRLWIHSSLMRTFT
jgi:RHS repeat-associated protein